MMQRDEKLIIWVYNLYSSQTIYLITVALWSLMQMKPESQNLLYRTMSEAT